MERKDIDQRAMVLMGGAFERYRTAVAGATSPIPEHAKDQQTKADLEKARDDFLADWRLALYCVAIANTQSAQDNLNLARLNAGDDPIQVIKDMAADKAKGSSR